MVELRFNSSPWGCMPFLQSDQNLEKQLLEPVSHVDEGEDGVEGGQHHVREGEIQEEVICYAPHSAVG